MRIGVSAFVWDSQLTSAHIDLIPKLKAYGLDGFEIPIFDPTNLAAPDLHRKFKTNQLECTVCVILPTGINPISPDSSVRSRSSAYLKECVEIAAEAGAHLIGGPLYAPIGYLPRWQRTEDEWNWGVECFQSLGDVLDSFDMTLSIEPVNRSETFFLTNAAEAKGFCEAVGHPRVGVTIDTFHANIEEKNIASTVSSLGSLLKHIHVSENDRGLLGSGHVDFPGVIAALRKIDYKGFLMIEGIGRLPNQTSTVSALWGDLRVPPEDIAFEGTSYLRKLLQLSPADATQT
jgi:D-psicose/D-tagatose/L-ribulose 3-epimerase